MLVWGKMLFYNHKYGNVSTKFPVTRKGRIQDQRQGQQLFRGEVGLHVHFCACVLSIYEPGSCMFLRRSVLLMALCTVLGGAWVLEQPQGS